MIDPKTLTRTAILDGAAIDVDQNAAIFDLPAEVRTYSLDDPLHPLMLASTATEGSKTPVSITSAGNIYVLGDKLYSYNASLAKIGEQYDSYQADLTNTLQYTDQRVRHDGNCILVSGRTFAPQFTSGDARPEVPAVVKSIAAIAGRFYVLTDDSIEVWSNRAATPAPRRRPTK